MILTQLSPGVAQKACIEMFECKYCEREFKYKCQRDAHERSSRKGKKCSGEKVECELCGARLPNEDIRERHLRRHHGISFTLSDVSEWT